MSFRLVPKLVTLNDIERHNNHSHVAAVDPFGLSWAMIISEMMSQCATCVTLCDNRAMMFVDELFKFVFYVVLFDIMVKNYRNIFCGDHWFITVI